MLLLALLAVAAPLRAQEERSTRLTVDPATGAPVVDLGRLLDDAALMRALHSGLPLRIRVVVQLWRDQFFDSQRGMVDWRASVLYDPLARTYQVRTEGSPGPDASHASLREVGTALQGLFPETLSPREPGSYYYLGHLEVETLSLSDLEELQRWLKGDLAPAVAGDEDVENALEKGVRRLMVRVLGLPAQRLRLRTDVFRWVGPPSGEGDPPGGEAVDPLHVRPDPDAGPVGELQGAVHELELGRDQVPLPIAPAGGDVPREGEARKAGQGQIVGPAHPRLEHAPAPDGDAVLTTQVVDRHGVAEAADAARLDVDDPACPELHGQGGGAG